MSFVDRNTQWVLFCVLVPDKGTHHLFFKAILYGNAMGLSDKS